MKVAEKLGEYTLVRHLATGGMAEIWLAEQEGPGGFNKELVIKRILPHFAQDEQFTTMFLDEARLAAQLSHPKIAQIYQLGEIDGSYFIAMEYIDGIDLDKLIDIAEDKGEPIPVDIAAKIVMDVLEALDYAHDFTDREGKPYGLVHRDVSPHNVMVSNDGIVKLCDFGVAKAVANQSKTQPGAVKGKFAYMAPEQIESKEVDRRADIFAVGILLYETLTGVKAFGDELAAINGIVSQQHQDPRELRPDIPETIVHIIDKALTKDRDARYPDAHFMIRDLEGYLRSEGQFVGDRELKAYVRSMQGLPPTTRGSMKAQAAPTTKPEPPVAGGTPVPSAPSTGQNLAAHGTPDPSTPVLPTARIPGADTGPEPAQRTNTQSVEADAEESHLALYAAFAFVLLAIVGAAVVAGYLFLSQGNSGRDDNPQKPKTAKNVHKHTGKPEEKADPSVLRHADGTLIFIASSPSNAQLFVDGKLAGTTPFDTQLRPGKYEVELRKGKKKVTRDFTVEPNKPIQHFKLKF